MTWIRCFLKRSWRDLRDSGLDSLSVSGDLVYPLILHGHPFPHWLNADDWRLRGHVLTGEMIPVKHLAQCAVHLTSGSAWGWKKEDTKVPKFIMVHPVHPEDKGTECEGNGHSGSWGVELLWDWCGCSGFPVAASSPSRLPTYSANGTVANDSASRLSGASKREL